MMKPKELTPDQIRQIRLNQPSKTTEEVIAQFEKNRQARISAETEEKSGDSSARSSQHQLHFLIAPVSVND